jgi:hypothetical protein
MCIWIDWVKSMRHLSDVRALSNHDLSHEVEAFRQYIDAVESRRQRLLRDTEVSTRPEASLLTQGDARILYPSRSPDARGLVKTGYPGL